LLPRGSPACGPGCGEWIAADGTIDQAAAQRFRTRWIVRQAQAAGLLSFSGWIRVAAMEIGRLMRRRPDDAAVARTIRGAAIRAGA